MMVLSLSAIVVLEMELEFGGWRFWAVIIAPAMILSTLINEITSRIRLQEELKKYEKKEKKKIDNGCQHVMSSLNNCCIICGETVEE
jgi:hypothetical protein